MPGPTTNPALTAWKDAAQTTQSVLTSLAILIGAFWFFLRRGHAPCASVTHRVTHLPLREGKILLRLSVAMENKGSVLIRPQELSVRVQQIVPLPDVLKDRDLVRDHQSEADWTIIGERTHYPKDHEIEPGESDEFHFDFELDDSVETVLVYSYIKNRKKKRRRWSLKWREIGWNTTTTYGPMRNTEPE